VIRRLVPVVLISIAVLFAACSSGDSTSGSPTPTPTGGGGGSTNTPTPTAGGGGSGTAAATSTATTLTQGQAPDPCSLLTQDEVSNILGHPVEPGGTPTDGHECDYTWNDPSSMLHFVTGSITVNEDLDIFAGVPDGRDDVIGATISHISGVGDEAVQVVPDLGVPFLYFRKGNLAFETDMQDSAGAYSTAQQESVDKELALAALPRIP